MKTTLTLFVILSALLTANAFAMTGGKKVTYKVDGEAYEGYYISPKKNAPLILLVHDWDGLTDYEVKRSNMLADKGYAVFAVDLFGAGVRPTEVKDKKQHTGELYKDRKKMRALLDGAMKEAIKLGGNKSNAVAMGYCFGGAAVLEMARSGAGLKGFATFHGGLKTPEGQSYKDTNGKLLVLHGTADTAITMEDFATLANELESQKIDHEMVSYGGAPHAFTVFGSKRYREDADKKSWDKFISFLEDTL